MNSLPLLTLPPLPDYWPRLSSEESARLAEFGGRAWPSPKDTCLTCNKQTTGTTQYRWYAPRGRSTGQVCLYDCACKDQFLLYQGMLHCGLGLNYMRVGWEDKLELPGAAFDTVGDYILAVDRHVSDGTNLILHSPQSGTGKTFLASLLTKRLISMGVDVYFATLPEILDLYTSTWRSDAERTWFNRRVRGAQVLVIDDLGREHPGRAQVVDAMLDALLRYRIASALPTVMTTNLQPGDLSDYGSNLASLLTERCILVEVGGADKRPMMTARSETERALDLRRPIVVA